LLIISSEFVVVERRWRNNWMNRICCVYLMKELFEMLFEMEFLFCLSGYVLEA
jgi:hypothetical protein